MKNRSMKNKRPNDSASNIELELDLLCRHMAMLKAIIENEPIGIIRLSEMLDIPQHKVRYSLRVLEQEGLIKPSLEGAVTTEDIENYMERFSSILNGIGKSVTDIKKLLK